MGGGFTSWRASGWSAGALCLALLGGCGGGGERTEPAAAWTPSGDPSGEGAAAAGSVTLQAPGSASPAFPRTALENAGEIELARGTVQRVYRVRFHNGPRAQVGLVAQLVSTGSSATVVDGRVVVGDLAPGAVVTPADTITLRHASGLVIDTAALRWQLTETERGGAAAGTLLLGPPAEPAAAALRDYALPAQVLGTASVATTPAAPRAARLIAVIERDATVEQVNAALRSAGARIAQMRPGNHTLVLGVPDPGRVEELRRLAARLQASAAFESVALPPPTAPAASSQAPPDPEPEFNDHRDI